MIQGPAIVSAPVVSAPILDSAVGGDAIYNQRGDIRMEAKAVEQDKWVMTGGAAMADGDKANMLRVDGWNLLGFLVTQFFCLVMAVRKGAAICALLSAIVFTTVPAQLCDIDILSVACLTRLAALLRQSAARTVQSGCIRPSDVPGCMLSCSPVQFHTFNVLTLCFISTNAEFAQQPFVCCCAKLVACAVSAC
jgi:hypothetical protein